MHRIRSFYILSNTQSRIKSLKSAFRLVFMPKKELARIACSVLLSQLRGLPSQLRELAGAHSRPYNPSYILGPGLAKRFIGLHLSISKQAFSKIIFIKTFRNNKLGNRPFKFDTKEFQILNILKNYSNVFKKLPT